MKIAFASCMCTQVFDSQPVWDQVAAENPDHLILLGDSIYLDIDSSPHPQEMGDDEFARHVFKQYTELLNQPQFRKLIDSFPSARVFSIWDDHDFLWNDACGAQLAPLHKEKIRISTAFQRLFRECLASGLDNFPTVYDDARFWNPSEPPLATPSIALADDCMLHLADVRTFRTQTWLVSESKRTILGQDQRDRISQQIAAHPEKLHLLASGTTISDWKPYANDLAWLRNQAKNSKLIVLSGDIHRNEHDHFPPLGKGWGFYELTSSGAAVKDAVVVGKLQQNYGILEIDGATAAARFYSKGAEQKKLALTLDLAAWS